MNHTWLAGAHLPNPKLHPSYSGCAFLRLYLVGLVALAALPGRSLAQVSVLTANGDNNRTNANLFESYLTPKNVRPEFVWKARIFSGRWPNLCATSVCR